MADKTHIEWTDATWNPITGCTEVSPGCDHCYAKTLAERFRGTPGHYFEHGFDVQLRPDKLDQPLRWRKPRRIFVNSMSDLFHEAIPDDYIARVWAVMAWSAPHGHTFQVLTKRHGRMRSLLNSPDFRRLFDIEWCGVSDWWGRVWDESVDLPHLNDGPLPNVWLGVSVEDQKWADIRIPALADTPAAVRFLSMEPLLGAVDISAYLPRTNRGLNGMSGIVDALVDRCDLQPTEFGSKHVAAQCRYCTNGRRISWVIVGGESGAGARPMHPDWARSLRDQCQASGVPFLFKQWGEWAPGHRNVRMTKHRWQYASTRFARDGTVYRADQPDLYSYPGMESLLRVGKRTAGRVVDGRTWDEYPEQLVTNVF